MCEHLNFAAAVDVNRLTDEGGTRVKSFMADVRVKCADCGKPFQFLGLMPGVDTAGAKVSMDGLEARLAISPEGVLPNPMHRLAFGVRSSN